jgi:S-layer like family, C-terminal region
MEDCVSFEYDIAINLASAAIGGSLVTGFAGAQRFRAKRDERFWKFLENDTLFVVGELQSDVLMNTLYDALEARIPTNEDRQNLVDSIIRHVRGQELSGLIGRGDFDAIVNLVVKYASLKMPDKPKIVHPPEVVGAEKRKNLVLIGGPDVNSLTESMSPRLGCRLSVKMNSSGRNVVYDDRLKTEHPAKDLVEPDDHGEVRILDYGMLVRARNPDNPDSEVMILAGAHGLGTLAATEVCTKMSDQKRLTTDLGQFHNRLECLVSYERTDVNTNTGSAKTKIEFSREIDEPSGNGT